ncbi:MAG TPA: molybdopterin-synthase adenylyltransferase MoeB [Verrucomicrobiota bacterium]|nr:molybdopterin-synthase adenylyltransferase MoeB [Verrucomicrobiota bacterium]HNU51401.1 molybdopterin-synthase adenylyltransferase MoeB [Verrucomicrobiota bacterium]
MGRITLAFHRMSPKLDADDLERYARHLMLPEVGPDGQNKLRAGRVLCVGAGGLGSPVILYLAAAGVGHLGIVDADRVELSNLQRQVLHGTPDVGRRKTHSARSALRRLNPGVEVRIHPVRLEAANARRLVEPYALVVDACDNLPTRHALNEAAVALRKPIVYGAVHRFTGQVGVLAPHWGGPCYRCLYPEPPSPDELPEPARDGGPVGVVPGLIGVLQAAEVLKLLLGSGRTLLGRLLEVDVWSLHCRELKVRRDPECPCCGSRARPTPGPSPHVSHRSGQRTAGAPHHSRHAG